MIWIAVGLLGCPRAPEAQVEAPTPPAVPETCVDQCMQRNMMRAVSIEVIRADCEAGCTNAPADRLDGPTETPQ